MHKTLAGTGLTLLLLSSTVAAEGMAGISLGQATFEDSALNTYGLEGDTRSTSYKLYGGMALGSHLSAHAGIFSLGKTTSSQTTYTTVIDPATNTPIPVADGTATTSFEVSGFFVEGRWQWRAGEAWRPYMKLSMAMSNSTLQTKATPLSTGLPTNSTETSQSSISFAPGAGIVYESLRHWGIQLEAEKYFGVEGPTTMPDQNINNINLGVYGYW